MSDEYWQEPTGWRYLIRATGYTVAATDNWGITGPSGWTRLLRCKMEMYQDWAKERQLTLAEESVAQRENGVEGTPEMHSNRFDDDRAT